MYLFSGAIGNCANSEAMYFPEEVASAGFPNGKLVPDWSTEQVLPWACCPGVTVTRVYCEQLLGSRSAALKNEVVPRTVCARLVEQLRQYGSQGLELFVGGELEFTVAKPAGERLDSQSGFNDWIPLWRGIGTFATLQTNKASDYFYDLEREMETVGVDLLTVNAECGEGQLEITFAPKFGVEAADAISTFRTGAKEIAQNKGLLASFISRPFGVEGVGNGGHFNFSLWCPGPDSALDGAISRTTRGKRSAMHSTSDPSGLSDTAQHFLAGVLAHAPALEALCAPTTPCYTRHGHWAPVVSNWGMDDRLACVRVQADPAGSPEGCYMELRLPSASANPYLVMAGVIAAGLDGLQRKLELPPHRQSLEQGAVPIPTSLEAALAALEQDAHMVNTLGTDFVRWYAGVKRLELSTIEAWLEKTGRSDSDVSSAWRRMYFEFV